MNRDNLWLTVVVYLLFFLALVALGLGLSQVDVAGCAG